MEKLLNTRYTAVHASYWGIFCVLNGYAAVFLASKGFTAGQTGILLSISNILAAVLQPIAASKADKPGKVALKELILIFGMLSMISSALLCMGQMDFYVLCLIFCMALVSAQILQPLINAVSMYYLNQGENISYGFARGIGSLAYAGMSSLIGILISRVGEIAIPLTAVLLYLIFLLLTFSFKIHKHTETKAEKKVQTEGVLSIFTRYKKFLLFLLGVICMFIFHFMTNTYMFQIMQSVGGDSKNMGIAISIAAMCEIPVMFLFSKIVSKIPVETLLRVSGIWWIIKAVTLCFCTNVIGIYINQLLQMLAFGLYTPASVYYANQMMDEENKVKGQAMITVAFTVGSVFGNLFGGKLIDWYNVHWMLIVGTGCTFLGAVLFFAGTSKTGRNMRYQRQGVRK